MDWITIRKRLIEFIQEYKFAVLILFIGILFLLVPAKQKKTDEIISVPMDQPSDSSQTLEKNISDLLSKIEGVGRAEVLLSVSAGEQTIFETNENHSIENDREVSKEDFVILTDANRCENGVIRQIIPPEYLGAVVVCQGANHASVRLQVIEAVSKLTGLSSDKISVLKMK